MRSRVEALEKIDPESELPKILNLGGFAEPERVAELQTQLPAVKSASSRFRAIQQRVETK